MQVISRSDAQAQGLKRYFTGKLCKHGHTAERLLNCRVCVTCHSLYANATYHRSPDRKKENATRWQQANPERRRVHKRRWAKKNTERVRLKNKARDKRITIQPLSKVLSDAVFMFYAQAPLGLHVDHIIPVSHKDVCGLHQLHNLQYLTPKANFQKNSHFNPDEHPFDQSTQRFVYVPRAA